MSREAERKNNFTNSDLLLILRDHSSYKWKLIETPDGPSHIILEQELDGEYINALKIGAAVKIQYTKQIPGQESLNNIEATGVVESFEELSQRLQGDGLKIATFRINVKLNPD